MACLALCVLGAALIPFAAAEGREAITKVHNLDNCKRNSDEPFPNRLDDIFLSADTNGSSYVSGKLVITGELVKDQNVYVEIIISKCLDGEDNNSCNKYFEFGTNLCESIDQKGWPWSEIVDKMKDFKPECPVEPGVYPFEKAHLEMPIGNLVSNPTGFWNLAVTFVLGKETLMCVEMSAKVQYAKRERKKKPRNQT